MTTEPTIAAGSRWRNNKDKKVVTVTQVKDGVIYYAVDGGGFGACTDPDFFVDIHEPVTPDTDPGSVATVTDADIRVATLACGAERRAIAPEKWGITPIKLWRMANPTRGIFYTPTAPVPGIVAVSYIALPVAEFERMERLAAMKRAELEEERTELSGKMARRDIAVYAVEDSNARLAEIEELLK